MKKSIISGLLAVIRNAVCAQTYIFCFLLMSCATQPRQSLYAELGGEQGVAAIVENLIKRIGNDEQIFHFFAESKISRFREQLQSQLCAVSDGPCQYTGDSMRQVHAGMAIQEKDFNHLVELLIGAMEEAGIAVPVQNRLLARLAPMRDQIIRH